MTSSRREALSVMLTTGLLPVTTSVQAASGPAATGALTPSPKVRQTVEGQRRGDCGNGFYVNPILAGDHADPAILKDGDVYYAAFTSFEYYPGLLLWRSNDLVNWQPMSAPLNKTIGSVYAVDIVKHGGRYFIYMPVLAKKGMKIAPEYSVNRRRMSTFVIHAESMEGPWSDPIDIGLYGGIDPSHVVGEDGKRYLYISDGRYCQLSDDGLKALGTPKKVYDGWAYPDSWIVEGFSLEGPWVIHKDGWFYMFSAQGGTAGPPTSHMIVAARSRSVHGPWENCPHNPIVHTASRDEPWWSRGHPAAVQGPSGDWWLLYHGYENGFRTLGRQLLLDPLEWTSAGWPRTWGGDLSRPLPKPRGNKQAPHGLSLSGPFTAQDLGRRMAFYRPEPDYFGRCRFENGALVLRAQGSDPADASPLALITGDRWYEMSVEIEVGKDAYGGLVLFYNETLFCGVDFKLGEQRQFRRGKAAPGVPSDEARLFLKVINDRDVATFYRSLDSIKWHKIVSYEVSGYNHNIGDGFISLRPALVSSGSGEVVFRNLTYSAERS